MNDSLKNVIVWQGKWTPQDCRDNPDCTFVFGDNQMETGKGGQAVIRDEPNTFGIWTKVKPSMEDDAFFQDKAEAFRALQYCLGRLEHDISWGDINRNSDTVVFSENGYGNGLARLDTMYSHAYSYLCERIAYLVRFFGTQEHLERLKFPHQQHA